jgi:hypothetical protein
VPHHQGAIDMAEAELRYGRNEPLRGLAQEIIATQEQQIAVMRRAVGELFAPSLLSSQQSGSRSILARPETPVRPSSAPGARP